jgi:predicted transcriptional regulator
MTKMTIRSSNKDVYKYIEAHPYANLLNIADGLGISKGAAQPHCCSLEECEAIECVGEWPHECFKTKRWKLLRKG